jgi:hypothetical protein
MVCFGLTNLHRVWERKGSHIEMSNAFLTSVMNEGQYECHSFPRLLPRGPTLVC